MRRDDLDPDDALLDELRAVVAAADPLPPHLVAAAEAAFDWRSIDDELAELLGDSVAEPELAGVRAGEAARLLSFAGSELRVELEVTGTGPVRRLQGQLVPPAPARIAIRGAAGVVDVVADAYGRFVASDVPAGAVSLRCVLDAAPHRRALATPW